MLDGRELIVLLSTMTPASDALSPPSQKQASGTKALTMIHLYSVEPYPQSKAGLSYPNVTTKISNIVSACLLRAPTTAPRVRLLIGAHWGKCKPFICHVTAFVGFFQLRSVCTTASGSPPDYFMWAPAQLGFPSSQRCMLPLPLGRNCSWDFDPQTLPFQLSTRWTQGHQHVLFGR